MACETKHRLMALCDPLHEQTSVSGLQTPRNARYVLSVKHLTLQFLSLNVLAHTVLPFNVCFNNSATPSTALHFSSSVLQHTFTNYDNFSIKQHNFKLNPLFCIFFFNLTLQIHLRRTTINTYKKDFFQMHHPRCVGSVTKNFFCITHRVENNYISPSSTVGIQLHVSALYVGHLQVVIYLTEQLYKMCVVFFQGIGGWVGGTRSRCFNSGYHDLGLL